MYRWGYGVTWLSFLVWDQMISVQIRVAPLEDIIMKQVNALSAKRYGPRYGKSNRFKVGQIEQQYRTKSECPYCHAVAVKRLTRGIFGCNKCGSIFTGRAYTAQKTQVKR